MRHAPAAFGCALFLLLSFAPGDLGSSRCQGVDATVPNRAVLANSAPLFRWFAERGGTGAVACSTATQGLRGLVATRDVRAGDLLLEVPLPATLADVDQDGTGSGEVAAGGPVVAAPAWASGLPWNVQMALGVLERRSDPEWAPFVGSWPEAAPLLPKDLDDEELEEGQDEDFEMKAGCTYFWAEEQYEAAREAHEASGSSEPFPNEAEFRWALAHVWTRCCRMELGSTYGGTRRLLVPVLDLGNHVSVSPSAEFVYRESAPSVGGPAVCLVAERDMSCGEAVTYSYGEHANAHFLLYYGFVPLEPPNPYEYVPLSLFDVLKWVPDSLAPPPSAGWRAAATALSWSGYRVDALPLRAVGPPEALLQALYAALKQKDDSETWQTEARAIRALSLACKGIESEYKTGVEEDEFLLRDPPASAIGVKPLSPGKRLMVQLRLGRKRLLRQLGGAMEELAQEYERDPERARRRLGQLVQQSEEARKVEAAASGSPIEEDPHVPDVAAPRVDAPQPAPAPASKPFVAPQRPAGPPRSA